MSLLRWWIFAFMFQRTSKYSVYEEGTRLGALVHAQLGGRQSWAAPLVQGSAAAPPVPAAVPLAALLWKDLVIFLFKVNFH